MGVAGKVDLGHNGHVPGRGVRHDAGIVLSRVEAARVAVDGCPGCEPGEFRARGNLDPPPLVIGQVQVEVIELELRRPVDDAEHRVDREEVARDIEHDAAVGKARGIRDRHGRYPPSGRRGLDQLHEGLDAIEQSRGIRPGHLDAVCGGDESVGLGGSGLRDDEGNARAGRRLIHSDLFVRPRRDEVREDADRHLVATDRGPRSRSEPGSLPGDELAGDRDDAGRGGCGSGLARRSSDHVKRPNK